MLMIFLALKFIAKMCICELPVQDHSVIGKFRDTYLMTIETRLDHLFLCPPRCMAGGDR